MTDFDTARLEGHESLDLPERERLVACPERRPTEQDARTGSARFIGNPYPLVRSPWT